MSMEESTQQGQTPQENAGYNEAVSRFQQACNDVKAKKSAMYKEFQDAEALIESGMSKRIRLESGDPFSAAEVDRAVKDTGDPFDEKRYVAYGRSIAMSIFCDDAFSEEVARVIRAVSKDAKAEEDALVNEVMEAEKELEESSLRLKKKVTKARHALEEHREKIQRDIIFPAIKADTFLLDCLPGYLTGPAGSRNLAIRTGYNLPVSELLRGLLEQMNIERYYNHRKIVSDLDI